MIRLEQWMDIKHLQRQGLSQREIARQTGLSRNTVAKLLNQTAPKPFQKPVRKSCLDPYKPYLIQRWQQYRLSGVRLLEEIKAQGYGGSLDVVQRFLKTLKEEQTVRTKATVRFETPPGQQAQADWAYVGEESGKKIYAFVMILSFSRMLYLEFTRSMDTPTLIQGHQNAFAFFGGIPSSVLYDNMTQVRLLGGGWNPLFADFALHLILSICLGSLRYWNLAHLPQGFRRSYLLPFVGDVLGLRPSNVRRKR
jgi:transposase